MVVVAAGVRQGSNSYKGIQLVVVYSATFLFGLSLISPPFRLQHVPFKARRGCRTTLVRQHRPRHRKDRR